MKRHFFIICLTALMAMKAGAQSDASDGSHPAPKRGTNNEVTLALNLPFGVFQRSHFGGFGVGYSWSNKRFGTMALPKKVGLIMEGGVDYFFGKKVETAGYPFQYDNYLVAQARAGVIYNPWVRTHVALTAGPVLGIYKGFTDWGYTFQISGAYYAHERFSIGPAFTVRKFKEADALWAGTIRLSYSF